MSKNVEGPPCLACGSPLRPERTERGGLTEPEARELKRMMDPGYRAALRKPHSHVIGSDRMWRVSYQTGWGRTAGAFCGPLCAGVWASKRVKPYKFDPTTNRP